MPTQPTLSLYRQAQLQARAAAGRASTGAMRDLYRALTQYGDDITARLSRLDVATDAQRIRALEESRIIILQARDDLTAAAQKAVADGRDTAFDEVLSIQQDAALAAAKLHGIPNALLGGVRVPPLVLVGAYENLGGAAAAWQSLIQVHTAKAAQDAEAIVRNAITQGVSPMSLSRDLRAYVTGAEAFHQAKLVRTVDGKQTVDLRSLKDPSLREAARRMRYNADRIAFSEIHNGRREAEVTMYAADPMVDFVTWVLASLRGNVDAPDECDGLANSNLFGLGRGAFPIHLIPIPPHPYDRCETIPNVRDVWDAGKPKPTPTRDPSAGVNLGANVRNLTRERADKLRQRVLQHIQLTEAGAQANPIRDLMERATQGFTMPIPPKGGLPPVTPPAKPARTAR